MFIMEETQPDVLWELVLSRKLFYKYKNIPKIKFYSMNGLIKSDMGLY